MKTHMKKLYRLLQENGNNPSIKLHGSISIPMIIKDGSNKDIFSNKLEYSVLLGKHRLVFMLVTDVPYLCGEKSCLDDLASITARFIFNHNPERLNIDMDSGIFAISQERTMGIFQTAENTMTVLADFMEKSKNALQWIVFRTNSSLYESLWSNEDPPEQFHFIESDI